MLLMFNYSGFSLLNKGIFHRAARVGKRKDRDVVKKKKKVKESEEEVKDAKEEVGGRRNIFVNVTTRWWEIWADI